MSPETWINLAVALIPSALIWVFKSGKKDQERADLAAEMAEFREENKTQAEELRADLKERTGRLLSDFKEQTSYVHQLDMRVYKLEEFRHNANNRLQLLSGQVDDLRVRKN